MPKTHLSRLLERVQHGEKIVIARAGNLVAGASRSSPPPARGLWAVQRADLDVGRLRRSAAPRGLPGIPAGIGGLLGTDASCGRPRPTIVFLRSGPSLIGDAAIRAFISVATTRDLTSKVMSGKLRPPSPPAEHFAEHIERVRTKLLPIHQRHVTAPPDLPRPTPTRWIV